MLRSVHTKKYTYKYVYLHVYLKVCVLTSILKSLITSMRSDKYFIRLTSKYALKYVSPNVAKQNKTFSLEVNW